MEKIQIIATVMISLSTMIGVIGSLSYYLIQITDTTILTLTHIVTFYILVNLLIIIWLWRYLD